MMRARLKLLPGQKGTKALVSKYGDDLLCVRYRYDEATCTRVKTVELIVETKPWTPPGPRYRNEELVPVRIAYSETALKNQAKAARGTWDAQAKLWFIQYDRIKGTPLEKHIVLDATDKFQKT